jgi:serine/threonine protein kinase
MLLNEVPFPGENFVAVAMRHINEDPPSIRDKRPDVPPRVEAAVHRAMAKDPDDRFPSMAEFCEELESCLAELQGTQVMSPVAAPARRAGSARRRISPWPVVVVLLALIATGAAVAYLVVHGTTPWGGSSNTGSSAPGVALQLSAVTAFDPFGSPPGQEHNADAPKATDKNSSTYWETESYHSTFAALGKKGVGLVLDAGKSVQLHQLGLATQTPGFTAVIRGGNSQGGPFGDYLSASQTAQGDTQFALHGGKHRYYLIWITSLPPHAGSVRINEVTAS